MIKELNREIKVYSIDRLMIMIAITGKNIIEK